MDIEDLNILNNPDSQSTDVDFDDFDKPKLSRRKRK